MLGAGAALIAAEWLTFRRIVAVTVVPPGGLTTGGAHHGYALALIGALSLPMTWGALRGGSRPAAAAVAALGAVALAIVLAVDYPALDDAGLIGQTYDLAEAHPAAGFWVQLVSAVVLLAGGLLLLRRNSGAAARRSRERDRERAARRDAEDDDV